MWSASVRSKGIDTTRFGLVSPNSGSTTEATFTDAAPDGVSFAFTSLGPLPRVDGSIVPALREVGLSRLEAAGGLLGTLDCEFVCMSGSIVGWLDRPEEEEGDVAARLGAAAGVPATTTSAAIESALAELDARRVAVVTSYDPTTLGVAREALTGLGCTVECHSLDRRGGVADDVALSTDRIYRFVRRHAREADEPDCVLVLGGSVPALAMLDDLEYDLDVPVVSDGQATLFELFRLAGVGPVDGHGELLRRV